MSSRIPIQTRAPTSTSAAMVCFGMRGGGASLATLVSTNVVPTASHTRSDHARARVDLTMALLLRLGRGLSASLPRPRCPICRGASMSVSVHPDSSIPIQRKSALGDLTSRVSWGAVFAGLVVATALQIVFTVLGAAIGLTALDGPDSGKAFGI